MESEKYVLNHNFGFGKAPDCKIKKLELRNFEDIKIYLKDILDTAIIAKINNFDLNFGNGEKLKIKFEMIDF